MHSHDTDNRSSSTGLLTAFVLNSLFAIVEIAGGVFTNSVAILSDALHDLGDSFALGSAWYLERLSRKGRDQGHSYGYRRYSVLGAIISAIVLICGSVFIISEAITRISNPVPVHSSGMIFLAIVGIVVNGFAFTRFKAGHSHNVEVVKLHLLEDVLGWVLVLIGSIVIHFWSIYVLDPIMSLIVSIWILYQVIKRLLKSLQIILQHTPSGITTHAVDQMIRALPGVSTTHDTHLWTMDGEYHVVTMHVVTVTQQSMKDLAVLKDAIRRQLNTLHINHVTIEFEYPDEPCGLMDC